jgi:LDH2 family malate/lactate/ureidoglycolate dehydrogenase
VDEFKQDMDELVRTLRSCPPQPGVEAVLLPGEKEFRTAAQRSRDGIPLHAEVVTLLRSIAAELQLESIV